MRFGPVERLQTVYECIQNLSRNEDWNDDGVDSPRNTAVHWFLNGAGRYLTIENTACESVIQPLYALLVVRETLQIRNDASWYEPVAHEMLRDYLSTRKGVTVHPEFGIAGLSLANSDLQGTLPSELAGLKHLTLLEIHSNPGVTGTIPAELSQMTALKQLNLEQTSLVGTVPESLSRLVNLEELLLDSTRLTGELPSEICALPFLKRVRVPSQVRCSCCTAGK